MTMTNQRGVETSFGEATVALPSREHGPALLPAAPQDLVRKTTQMWQRHLELTDAKRRGPASDRAALPGRGHRPPRLPREMTLKDPAA